MLQLRIFFCWLMALAFSSQGQRECGIKQVAFASGEELNYKVVYNWGLIWLESAQASFKVKASILNGKACYLLNGSGSTFPKYDWFFKVRDVFETQLDSATFKPIRFRADIQEGGKKDRHNYIFNNTTRKAYTFINRGNKPATVDTLKLESCTIDVLTAIYYARSLDYSKCRVNDTIGISLLLDGKVYATYIRYLGKAVYESKELGKYNCIKFSPLLIEGSIFKKGEDMIVWVSDDENKLPIYIETPIIVGTVKVSLSSYKGLKYPESAKIR